MPRQSRTIAGADRPEEEPESGKIDGPVWFEREGVDRLVNNRLNGYSVASDQGVYTISTKCFFG